MIQFVWRPFFTILVTGGLLQLQDLQQQWWNEHVQQDDSLMNRNTRFQETSASCSVFSFVLILVLEEECTLLSRLNYS